VAPRDASADADAAGGQVTGDDVAIDSLGRIVVAAGLTGTVDLGGGPLSSAGGADLVLVQYAPSGGLLWSESFTARPAQGAARVATDASNNLELVTSFLGELDIGSRLTSAGYTDICVAKLDASGHLLWTKQFGGNDQDLSTAIATDSSGAIVFSAYSDGVIDFGTGAGDAAAGGGYIVKLDAAGNVIWSKTWPATWVASVAVDSTGHVFATGHFRGTVDFGGGPLVSAGLDDIVLFELDPSGAHLWSRRFGGAATEDATDLALDGAGNLVLTGSFDGAFDFGGPALVSTRSPNRFAPSNDIFVARLDASGNHLWSHRYGDAENDQLGRRVSVDAADNILLAGVFSGSIDFGVGTMNAPPSGASFLVKMDATGSTQWSRSFTAGSELAGARASSTGDIFAAGLFSGRQTPSPLQAFAGGTSAFLLELPP
jgi:hypothetical protein